MEKNMLRVAACQLTPAQELDLREKQLENILKKSQSEKIDFICLPEGFLTGYYVQEEEARKNSLNVKSSAFNAWLEMTQGYDVTLIIGFNELENKHLFDSAAIMENGKLLGVQRKHYLYHPYFTPGISFSCFSAKGISFGVVICLDTNYFEPSRLLALQGASILFSPMCNQVSIHHSYAKRPLYYSHFIARSFENKCWLVTADWIWPNDGTMVCPGHTVIYNPNGQEIARSKEGEEQLLYYDIPPTQLIHEKGKRIHGSSILIQEIEKLNVQAQKSLGKIIP